MSIEYSKDYMRTLKRITKRRILMSITEEVTVLVCICDHDDYDFRNKNC